MRRSIKMGGIEVFTQHSEVSYLLWHQSQNAGLGIAREIPKPVAIQPVRKSAACAVVQRRTDTIDHSAVWI